MQLKKLTPEEEAVIVHKGTEPPFQGTYTDNFEKGTYACKRCSTPLYYSTSKFKSSCGWPSFEEEIEGAVKQIPDKDGKRIEIVCNHCGAHLGHIFHGEGLTKKNTRHCVNSISLQFIKKLSLVLLVFFGYLFNTVFSLFASENEPAKRSFLPDFNGLWEKIIHQVLRTPKHLFLAISRFIMSHLAYFGWGLLLIGIIIGLYLLFVYLANRPKKSPITYIQTNQPRQTQDEIHYSTTLFVTHANGYFENIPMYYDRMIIGRIPSCQIVLQDNNISEQQAEIYIQDSRYFVRDYGTGFPTYVNGSIITGITELFAGYYIQMGGSTIQL